jgi:nitronate monooxygenase
VVCGEDDPVVRLETELCRRLGIAHPVWCAGMGGVAGPELAAAVSEAGGLGVLGCAGAEPDWIAVCGDRLRACTARPFGFNFIVDGVETDEDRDFVRAEVAAAAAAGARLVVLFWGDPTPYVEAAHAADVLVAVQVGSVSEARAAVRAGVDVVIAQGVEAGGHVRGATSVWELLPDVVRSVSPIPVVASGGIGDGIGLARALNLVRRVCPWEPGSSPPTRHGRIRRTSNGSSRPRRRTRSTAPCSTSAGRMPRTG